jgi:hypothetical protein
MPDVLNGILNALVSTGLGTLSAFLLNLAFGEPLDTAVALVIGLILGFLYGLEAGLVLSYDLGSGIGWLKLIVDFTWSLPNTIFGLVVGNLIYVWFGWPNREFSRGKGYIAYKPRGSGRFGNDVLQTLGTVNMGGEGQHELMHVLQARIFGPLYLPVFALNYVVNFLVQGLWTITVGLILWLVKVRNTPYFRPPEESVVSGFFGWIYHSTVFELWAYGSGNPH